MNRKEANKIIEKHSAAFGALPREAIEAIEYLINVEPCEDCVSRKFIEIVVNYPPADLCAYPEYKGKPYFSIKYQENGKDYVGFGTYKIEILSQWLKEYFMSNIQPKPKMGRWLAVDNEDMYTVDYFCSECDLPLETAERTPFCPNCGEKMEVEENG